MRRILARCRGPARGRRRRSAATVPYRTDAELVAISNRVVRGRVLDSVAERAPVGRDPHAHARRGHRGLHRRRRCDRHRPRARRPPARRHRRVDPRRAAVRAGRRRRPVPRAHRRRLSHRVDGVLGVPRRRGGRGRSPADAIRRRCRRRRRGVAGVEAARGLERVQARGGGRHAASRRAPCRPRRRRPRRWLPRRHAVASRRRSRCWAVACAGSRPTAARRSPGIATRCRPSPVQGADTDDQLRTALFGVDRSADGVHHPGVRRHARRRRRPGHAGRGPVLHGRQPRRRPDHLRRSAGRAAGRRPRHRRRLRHRGDPRRQRPDLQRRSRMASSS